MSDPYSPYPQNPGDYGSSSGGPDSNPYGGQQVPPTEYGSYPQQQQQPYYNAPQQPPYASNDFNAYGGTPAPAYQSYGTPVQPAPTNVQGIVALILGIASIVMCWFPILGLPGGIAGVILGVIGMRKTYGKPLAVAGLICAIVGLVISACFGVFYIAAIISASNQ
jgi:hypothetical protein